MNKKLSNSLTYLIYITIAILVILLFRLIKVFDICCTIINIISPILFGYILAWILKPIYDRLTFSLGKTPSFLIIIAGLLLFYASLIALIIPIFTSEVGTFLDTIKNYIHSLNDIPFINLEESMMQIDTDTLIESCGGILSIIINFALINMFGFYVLCP